MLTAYSTAATGREGGDQADCAPWLSVFKRGPVWRTAHARVKCRYPDML